LLTNDKDASIARTIITLGQNLNLTVIAEGVETQEQREFLENEGCHIYQGFLFSPALPSSKFEAFVGASC
jgi:EAL domain-containing protein (putative c-di-GMP-specific phosphodiesterase class I)